MCNTCGCQDKKPEELKKVCEGCKQPVDQCTCEKCDCDERTCDECQEKEE